VALWALSRKCPDTYSAFGSYTFGHDHQENELARHGELGIVLNDIEEGRKQTEVKETHAGQATSNLYPRTATARHMIGKKSSRSKKLL
jgi:hypothetical protein